MSGQLDDKAVEKEMRRLTRRSFIWGGTALLAGFGGFKWLKSRRDDEGTIWPLRRVLEVNEEIARDLYSNTRLAPEFPVSAARTPRANGDVGLDEAVDAAEWRLTVEGLAGDENEAAVTLEQIKALPRVEMVTEFKCIEGWSTIVRWGGARLSDFISRFPPETNSGAPVNVAGNPRDLPEYVGMATPDGRYYVGLDMASALHPQTLLAYEMNGAALSPEHGAPLRLVTPVKYGVKNIKRIGVIRYSSHRPADYWAERGYDWYAGL